MGRQRPVFLYAGVENYLTLAGSAEGVYTDRGSRFLAYLYPVWDEAEALAQVEARRREHHAARHVCWGVVLQADGSFTRGSDDGEPSGTAARPIVGALRSAGLTRVVGIVVRYFGGIKLGVPGLIAAYRGAVQDALARAELARREVENLLGIQFAYAAQPRVMQAVKAAGARVLREEWGEAGRLEVACGVGTVALLSNTLSGLGVQVLDLGEWKG